MFYVFIVSFFYDEGDLPALVVSIMFTGMAGFLLRYFGQPKRDTMNRREAYFVVTLTWIVFSLFGALPFILSGYIPEYTNAFFETMSGFTTTGSTILDDVEALPHGLLLWRSMTQWIGGLGIAFFTIAILPGLVGGSIRVFSAEATGPMRTKMHPKLSTNAKMIISVYMLLTMACVAFYYMGGMHLFDAVNYAMTTTATGGFSTHNASTGYYKSPFIDYTAIVFMFLSGVNFTVLYLSVVKRQYKELLRNSELKFYVCIVTLSTIFIMLVLNVERNYNFSDALRCSLFQVVSFVTTTGLFNEDAGKWPHITWVVLSILMFIGACAGSTSGGFKCIRVVMIWKLIKNELKKNLHPKAVLPLKINGNNVLPEQQVTLLAFFAVYILLCVFTYFTLILQGIDSTNSLTIAISCASNVGPTLGLEIGPTMSWDMIPTAGKWLCSFLMLMGRLEILSVLVIFSPSFWRDN